MEGSMQTRLLNVEHYFILSGGFFSHISEKKIFK